MSRFAFYGSDLPAVEAGELKGKLIVVEGADGVGRSTHITLLKEWFENNGHAVLDTGMTRSVLAGKGLKVATNGNTLGRIAMSLFYATDFADRLENEIMPALRAGFVVLTDRYIYSLMARAIVRGADPRWIRGVYEFALKPDIVIFATGAMEGHDSRNQELPCRDVPHPVVSRQAAASRRQAVAPVRPPESFADAAPFSPGSAGEGLGSVANSDDRWSIVSIRYGAISRSRHRRDAHDGRMGSTGTARSASPSRRRDSRPYGDGSLWPNRRRGLSQ